MVYMTGRPFRMGGVGFPVGGVTRLLPIAELSVGW
jgi:hypothetical protein